MPDGPILVIAGGAGFIGANFARFVAASRPEWRLRILDKLTYAGDRTRLAGMDVEFITGDIADPQAAASALTGARWLVNFAAETHVDRSLQDAQAFLRTNVTGTFVLMSAASDAGVERIVHVSTDEVYGESHGEAFHEDDLLRPRSPYSASKAGGDLQVLALHATYGLPVCITRGANTIGGWQHPEKAVPLFTINALLNQPLPIYGRGEQRRDRLHVNDHCRAVLTVLEQGEPGTVYNVAAGNNRDNLTVARAILERLDRPEIADPVRRGPAGPRLGLHHGCLTAGRAWLAARARFRIGPRPHGGLVCCAPRLVGTNRVRRVPAVLRAPVRRAPGRVGSLPTLAGPACGVVAQPRRLCIVPLARCTGWGK